MTEALRPQELLALERQAAELTQRGMGAQALSVWKRIAEAAPGHVGACTQIGREALRQGDLQAARHWFERAAQASPGVARAWINVAVACKGLADDDAEEQALTKALEADPYELLALLLRGSLYERQGRLQQAASAFGAAATVAPPLDQLAPDLRAAVSHAQAFQADYQRKLATFLDDYLAPHLADSGPSHRARFQDSVDIMLGRKRRFDAQPMRYFVPRLPAIEFFDREHFPWLDDVEAAAPAVRDEFMAVLHQDRQSDFSPYIEYGADQPVAQWAELNHNPRWSAFHLVKDGSPVPGNAERCPRTMDMWSKTPWPDQPGRTPVALFSLLKPQTRIPPHVGASNCRLLVHLPLIVPADCTFRVGNQTRPWVPGQAWVFDDTVEHEAWNGSNELRVIMIFDTWHPMLTPDERRLITAMNKGLNAFSPAAAGDYGS